MKRINKIILIIISLFTCLFVGCSSNEYLEQPLNDIVNEFCERYDVNQISSDLLFITNDGMYSYTWESSNEQIITSDGVVARPDDDTSVTLIVTIHDDEKELSKYINCIVIAKVKDVYTYDLNGVKSFYSIYELVKVNEDGEYNSHVEVVAYIFYYKKLPSNYLTKSQAKKLGWNGSGSNVWVNETLKNKHIGGDTFNNYEKLLPIVESNTYIEVDVNCVNGARGKYRIVYNRYTFDIYYTADHYNSFTYMIGAA